MSKPSHSRADAVKNRERLVAAARARFSAGDGMVPLEGVARAADVGIATLYRHFPTREALVDAVYRSELDALATEASALLGAHAAWDALRMWMDRYAQFVATKRAMYDALRTALTSRTPPVSDTRVRIGATLAAFIAAGANDGTIRDDIEPDDVTVSLAGIVLATTGAADHAQLRRLLNLLMDGLRPHP